MITPGFFGLYNAQRGLLASQNALSTVSNNISNANTPGYSRQRVDITSYTPYTQPNLSQVLIGQLGQGPMVQQVTRSRDQFLDSQYRQGNSLLGLNSSIRDTLEQIQGVMNEPSDSGINTSMQNFFDSAQEMSLHPESAATRASFVQQAQDLVTVFQQQATQLADLRKNLVGDPTAPGTLQTSQLAISVGQVNTMLSSIAILNQNIVSVKASGAEPNDLMDQRDLLLDKLSNLVDIQVTNYANGQIDLSVGGQPMIQGGNQLDSLTVVANPTAPPGPAPNSDDIPAFVQTTNGGVVLNDGAGAEFTSGTVKGISDAGGNNPNLSTVRGVLGKIDTLLNTIVTQVNTLQSTGRDQNGNLGAAAPIFIADPTLNPTQALNIFHWTVNTAVVADPKLVAAANDDATAAGNFAGVGDGRNALALAQLRDQTLGALGATFGDFFNSVTSKLGIDTQSYQNTSATQNNLITSVDQQRQSVSGVNTDDEMIDMLRYQRGYEATSKTISIWDEITKNIIDMI